MNQVLRLRFLSHMRTAKTLASLCICSVSPEPSLLECKSRPFSILGVLGGIIQLPQIIIEHSLSKQWRPWSDTAFCGVWSGSALFAYIPQKKTLGLYGLRITSFDLHCKSTLSQNNLNVVLLIIETVDWCFNEHWWPRWNAKERDMSSGFILCVERDVCVCLFVCLIWFFTSHQQSFSHIGSGFPGMNQY